MKSGTRAAAGPEDAGRPMTEHWSMEVLNHERQGLEEVGPLTTSSVSLGPARLSRFATGPRET